MLLLKFDHAEMLSCRWCRAVVLLKEKYGYGWHLQRWGSKFSRFGDEVCKEDAKEMMQDASKFALDGDINLDILRKCFLIQVCIWFVVQNNST